MPIDIKRHRNRAVTEQRLRDFGRQFPAATIPRRFGVSSYFYLKLYTIRFWRTAKMSGTNERRAYARAPPSFARAGMQETLRKLSLCRNRQALSSHRQALPRYRTSRRRTVQRFSGPQRSLTRSRLRLLGCSISTVYGGV